MLARRDFLCFASGVPMKRNITSNGYSNYSAAPSCADQGDRRKPAAASRDRFGTMGDERQDEPAPRISPTWYQPGGVVANVLDVRVRPATLLLDQARAGLLRDSHYRMERYGSPRGCSHHSRRPDADGVAVEIGASE